MSNSYVDYITTHLDKSITYSEYLAENLNKNIAAEYLRKESRMNN